VTAHLGRSRALDPEWVNAIFEKHCLGRAAVLSDGRDAGGVPEGESLGRPRGARAAPLSNGQGEDA
jgi:hypothetical protein